MAIQQWVLVAMLNVVVANCSQVDQDGGVGKGAMHMNTVPPQGCVRCKPGADTIKLAEGCEVLHPCMVGSPCGGGNVQALKSCDLLDQVDITMMGYELGGCLRVGPGA